MNHPITVGGLILFVGALAGFLACGFGVLMFSAAMMSDAGDDGTGTTGCITFVAGAIVCLGCIAGLLL
jgi:hypothetical protein